MYEILLYTFYDYVALRKIGFLSLSSQFESKFSIRGYFLTCGLFLWNQLCIQILIFVYFLTSAVAFRQSALFMNWYCNFSSNLWIVPSNDFFFHIYQKLLVYLFKTKRISFRTYFICSGISPVPVQEVMLRNTWIVSAKPVLLLLP